MAMPIVRRRDPRVRILAAIAVALAHVYVLQALLAQRVPDASFS
jgi:hypothetical protein